MTESVNQENYQKIDIFKFFDFLSVFSFHNILIFSIITFICINGAWNLISSVFVGYIPESFHCRLPENVTLSGHIPTNSDGEFENCFKFVMKTNKIEPCGAEGWTYVQPYKPSITTKFNAVCDKAYLMKLADTTYMVGSIVVGPLLMPLSDWFGRKWIIIALLIVQAILNFGILLITSIEAYIGIRFFVGMTNRMASNLGFIFLNESFSKTLRAKAYILVISSWSLAMLALVLVWYIVPTWIYFQLFLGAVGSISLLFIWVMPESPVWLIANKKYSEVVKFMKKTTNDPHLSLSMFYKDSQDEELIPPKKHTHLDLFRTTKIRRLTFILMFTWFVTAMVYFGLTFSIGSFKGNFYLNMTLNALVEVPSYIMALVLTSKFGGKKAIIVSYFIAGVCNIVAALMVPELISENGVDKIALASTVIGKFGITATYSIIGLLTSEVMPTVIRSISDGVMKAAEGIGGVLATVILASAKAKGSLEVMTRALFGVLAILAGIFILFLPDTDKKALPDTVKDVEETTSPVTVQD